jgi:hypothetical protein
MVGVGTDALPRRATRGKADTPVRRADKDVPGSGHFCPLSAFLWELLAEARGVLGAVTAAGCETCLDLTPAQSDT